MYIAILIIKIPHLNSWILSKFALKRLSPSHPYLSIEFILFLSLTFFNLIRPFSYIFNNRKWLSFPSLQSFSPLIWLFGIPILLHEDLIIIIGMIQFFWMEITKFQMIKIHLLEHLPVNLFLVKSWSWSQRSWVLLLLGFHRVIFGIFCFLLQSIIFLLFLLQFFYHF